ncbi:MAG: ABC transporter ATP-binding protein [Myxococcota bacterium]
MLEASSVRRAFGSVVAVDDLNLSVAPGELFCMLGANGAGKTTTINLFLGFIAPDRGTLSVGGVTPGLAPRAARRKIAYIPENVALYPYLTGLENLELFHEMARGDRTDLEDLLVESGIGRDKMNRRVDEYSKGMRQKVGLAIAKARGARALLLDEPMSGLDPAAANDFCRDLVRVRESGAAVLMTTHDLFRAKELGGTIGIMRAGRLVDQFDATDVDANELESRYLHHMRETEEAL